MPAMTHAAARMARVASLPTNAPQYTRPSFASAWAHLTQGSTWTVGAGAKMESCVTEAPHCREG